MPGQEHVGRLSDPAVGEHVMADHAGRIAQLEAENAALREREATLTHEVERLRPALAESLEQRTATTEVLRVIASSPTEVQAALDAILEAAARLCDALGGAILQLRETDGRLAPRAVYGRQRELRNQGVGSGSFRDAIGQPVSRESGVGHAFLEGRTVHVHDMAEAVESMYPASRHAQVALGFRTVVSVPLQGRAATIGVLSLSRYEVRPFTEQHVVLLESFA